MSNKKRSKTSQLSAASIQIRSLVFYCLLSLIVFSLAWYWLNAQLATLLERRVSDLGLVTAEVAAKASSEALVSEDTLFMQTLVDDLAAGEFIESATIYRLDGTLLAKSVKTDNSQPTQPNVAQSERQSSSKEKNKPSNALPSEHPSKPPSKSSKESSGLEKPTQSKSVSVNSALTSYLPQFQSEQVPYLVDIMWQNNHVGWVEVTLDRNKLEQDLRTQSYQITVIFIVILVITLIVGIVLIVRSFIQHKYRLKNHTEKEPETEPATLPATGLEEIAKQVKSGNFNSDNTHFFAPKLHNQSDDENNFLSHEGDFAIIAIHQIDHTPEITEPQLQQAMYWHKIILDSAATHQLPCLPINRQQYFIPLQIDDHDNLQKLTYLLHQIEQRLSESSNIYCRTSMMIGRGKTSLSKASYKVNWIGGEDFDSAAKLMRSNRSFATMTLEFAEQLKWDEQSTEAAISIQLADQSERKMNVPTEFKSVADRQASSLLEKYWRNEEESNEKIKEEL